MTNDDTTLEHCPTCGQLGCVGYCDLEDLGDDGPPQPPQWGPCCICHLNEVCYSEGYDTCDECLAKQ